MNVHATRGKTRFPWSILVLLTAGIVLLASLGVRSGDEAGAGHEPVAGLAVVMATPVGERQDLYSIDVTFSESMIGLGERGKRSGRGLIRFEPGLSGSYTWLGTRTVSFVLDSPPPRGTRIVCTLPRGTQAVSGRKLAEDHTWTILYRPARLLASIPGQPLLQEHRDRTAPAARHIPGDPILLAFDRPVEEWDTGGIALESAEGRIPLRRVHLPGEHLLALQRQNRRVDSLGVLALRPDAPLVHGKSYRLVLTPSLRFKGGPVGLTDSLKIPFRVPGRPKIHLAEAFDGGIRFILESPVDPDTFLAHMQIEPRPGGLSARGWSWEGKENISVFGDFPPGRSIEVLVPAGLRDMCGYPLDRPFQASIAVPPVPSVLWFDPSDGVIIPGPEEYLRITAHNTSPARIRWVWITDDEMPLFEAERGWNGRVRNSGIRFSRNQRPIDDGTGRTPWESRWQHEPDWPDPHNYPDSLCRWERRLVDFEPRSADAVLLLCEATALWTEGIESSGRPDTLLQSRKLQVTTLGISSSQGADRGVIWVTDLMTGLPIPGAAVSLWGLPGPGQDSAPEKLWESTTDADGICWTPGTSNIGANGPGIMARAESDGRVVWLSLHNHYSNRPRDGALQKSAFITTDRPVYRPGETIHWKGIVRRSDRAGLTPVDAAGLTAVLSGLRDTDIRLPVSLTPHGNPHGEIGIPETAPSGRYYLRLALPRQAAEEADQQDNSPEQTLPGTWVQVESFRPPRFRAGTSTTTPLVVSGEKARVTGSFGYFSGPPLSGQPVVWRTMRTPEPWSPPGWDRFRFRDDPAGGMHSRETPEGPSPAGSGEARLDNDGRLDLELPFILPPEAGDSRVTVEIGARDLADQSAYSRTQIMLVRGPYRPGVRSVIPESEGDGEGVWEWIVADTAGAPVEGLPVALELYKREWKTARVRRVGGTFDYETSTRDSVLYTLHAVSGPDPASQVFPISESGYYFLRAGVRQPDGSTLTAADGMSFSGETPFHGYRPGVTNISLEPDRTIAEPGDTVRVMFPAPPGGAQGLVLLESGGVISATRAQLHGTPSIGIPLGSTAPPDASISVIMAGPDRVPVSQATGPRLFPPFFARGSTMVRISPERWRALVDVRPDRGVAGPGEEIGIEIRLTTRDGSPLSGEVALAVIDEAVLALVEDQPRDPLERLFRRRGSGTSYSDTRYWLELSPLRGKGVSASGGGGYGGAGGMWSPRTDFRPTAYWNPALQVGADGVARVLMRLPDTLTSYRIRATAACEGEHHGFGEARFRTDQPLVVEPAAPRFVRLGDEWTLGAVVENHTDRAMAVEVRCEVDGAELRGGNRWRGKVGPGRTARADFRVRSVREGGVGYLLEANADGGSAVDRMRGSLICVDPVETIPEITFGRAHPVAEEMLVLSDDLLNTAGGLEVRISASLLSGLAEPIDYLIDYPHPCLEQRASRLLALLARRDLSDRMPGGGPDPAHLDSLMRDGLQSLRSHVIHGGLSLWPGSRGGDPYLDGYVLYTLSRLRKSRAEVPDDLYNYAWNTVRSRLEAAENTPGRIDPDTRAFLTYTMTAAAAGIAPLAGEVPHAVTDVDLERLDAARGGMSAAGRLCLVLAMGEMRGQRPDSRAVSARRMEFLFDEIAQGINRSARLASIPAAGSSWPWRSSPDDRVRATAMAALFLSENLPSHPLLPSMINWVLGERERGRWSNTHESAWALEAVRAYAERVENLILPAQGRLIPGMSTGRGFRFTEDNLAPVELRYTLEELSAYRRPKPGSDRLPLRIEAVGQTALYYEMRLERRLRALEGPPREEGLIVFREYVEAAGGKPTERLVRGEPLLVHLAVVVPWDAENLVLEDHLPAGVEALNLRLLTTSHLQPGSPHDAANASGRDEWGRSGGHSHERMPGEGYAEAPGLLPVSYRDLRDDRVILYADRVPAGVYHIYYPVAATTPGVYTVPGARAELMYSPEIFGSSGAARVEVR